MWAFLLVDIEQNHMAYPDYSFVITEEVSSINGEVVRTTEVYKKKSEAISAYYSAVESGKRAFLYENPPVSSFKRNNNQPLAI